MVGLEDVFYSLNKNRFWDYLNIDVLKLIIEYFLKSLQEELMTLKTELMTFLANTTVKQFYDAAEEDIKYRCSIPPDGFVEYISTHHWGHSTLLSEIERYRKRLESKLENKLIHLSVTVILVGINLGSVRVIFFVPKSSELSIEPTDISFFEENGIIELEVDHSCVYQQKEV